jgi:alpha-mannosidase
VNQYGEAFQTLDPNEYAGVEASWEDKTDYIREAARIVRDITANSLQALAGAVRHDAPGMIAYNPLPWTRSGWVEFHGERVWVNDVPACGYRIEPLPPASVRVAPRESSEPATIENDFFKLTVDPARGAITSLVDKRSGREWVGAEPSRGLGSYLNERFTFEQTLNYALTYQDGRAMNVLGTPGVWVHPGMHKPGMISEQEVPYRAATAANGVARIDGDSVTIECPADPDNHLPATALRVSLPKHQPYIDLELTIRDKSKDNWPEADWLCLPFQVASPRFRVHRQLGVMNPATDILPGANRDLFTVGPGVTISDADGSGIAVCPLDHPLVSLDRPGCWRFSKDAADFTPERPIVYVNLFNNQWNTNFRYWYPGTWSSRVRLWTFDAHTPPDAVMATPALEARNPLMAIATRGDGDRLPAEQSGLSVSRPGVLVTAFGANPDGHGTLLRVWEHAGVSGELTVAIPGGFTSATPVDLRGEPCGQQRPLAAGQLVFPLAAYAPSSWVLE